MRIDGVEVKNFRGIEFASSTGLADAPLVTVSGANGSGKSLLFEAITLLWRAGLPWGQYDLRRLVGPFSETCQIALDFKLSTEEREALKAYGVPRGFPLEDQVAPELIKISATVTKRDPVGELIRHADGWARLFWEREFRLTNPFSHIDYLPADRSIQRGEHAQVNPAMLSVEQTEGMRQQVFDTFIQQRQILNLQGVQPFLASLDYMDLLRARERKPPSGDFDAIAEPFKYATGKSINRPSIDPSSPFGATLYVDLPSGYSHSLDQLSSGEQEVLSLMYYARRLAASGGILLIDEPELHLHPALQRSFFSVVENVADRSQVWVVTHSSKLVNAAPLSAVLHMSPPDPGKNQLARAADVEARERLLVDLGVSPGDVLQNESIVVVEGLDDARRLLSIFDLHLSRTIVYRAGNARGVETTASTLGSATSMIPWLAIRDRDLLTDDEVAEKLSASTNLYIWPNRMLESEILDPALVARTIERSGGRTDVQVVQGWLKEIAESQKSKIVAELVEAELVRLHPYAEVEKGTPLEELSTFLQVQASSTQSKIESFSRISEEVSEALELRWNVDWFKLMDCKKAFGIVAAKTPLRRSTAFEEAVYATLREEPEAWPVGLRRLKQRIEQLGSD